MKEKLALLGGTPVLTKEEIPGELFRWPIITQEDEAAILDVVRNNKFSGTDITIEFEKEFAQWQGRQYALAFCNGTMSLAAAMFAVGLQAGDEMICTTKTYWASAVQAATFGASVVFCDIDDHMSMDPDDLERCIGPKTKAIMVVHYAGYPADMDRILAIAGKHGLKVIEDVSHAHGTLYKGRKVGCFGDVAAMSMMSQKAFAAGELGMLVTDNREYYERACAYGHYERNNAKNITTETLKPYLGIALGGVKGRANQVSTAMARVQLKYYDARLAEINQAMEYFCEGIGKLKGLYPIGVEKGSGSVMTRAYFPHMVYRAEELGGLSARRFAEAVRAEAGDCTCWEGANFPLHTHQYFQDFNLLGLDQPTRIAFADRDVRQLDAALSNVNRLRVLSMPVFRKFMPEYIDRYIAAFTKVVENYEQLLETDAAHTVDGGRWYGAENH